MTNDPGKEAGGNKQVLSHGSAGYDGLKKISSSDLFAGQREILIAHEDKTYRLRITNQGKLVLNL